MTMTMIDTYNGSFAVTRRFTVGTITENSWVSEILGTKVNNILINVADLDNNTPARHVLVIPTKRLLNGRKVDCIRTIRFNQLQNIISSYAKEKLNVNLNRSVVSFLGVLTPGMSAV